MAKLSGENKKQYLRERFEEQRPFLSKSIKEFVSGDLAEAVRIAITIRVLVHETGSSKSLLGQLTPNYLDLKILDRAPVREETHELPHGTQSVVVMSVPISVKMKAEGVFLNPDLDVEAYQASILGKWWGRHSLILPGLGGFSRKEIVRGLADKEGGAHVDTDINPKYQQLLDSKSLQLGWNQEAVSPLNLSRFMAGQAGVELLDCLDKNFPRNA